MLKQALTLILAILHASSGLTLLIVSSWFIAACAIAGVNFNYMLPAVIIRALAFIRIASGYGQMWLGHQALLDSIKQLRIKLFAKLKHNLISDKSFATEALAHHSEAIANIWIGWINHNASTLILLTISQVIIMWLLPTWSLYMLGAIVAYLLIISWLCLKGLSLSNDLFQQLTEFRRESSAFLASSAIWHQMPKLTHPQADAIWQTRTKIDDISNHAMWLIQLYSYAALFLALWQYANESVTSDDLGSPLLLIGIMLLFSARDWLTPGLSSQSALTDYLNAKQHFDNIPMQTVAPAIELDTTPLTSISLSQFKADIPATPAIDLQANQHDIVLIKGSSGVGKSTLLKACCGLLPCSGKRKRNDIELPLGRIQQWCYVEQNPNALSATLASNLRLGNPSATDEALKDVLNKVGLGSFSNLNEWIGTGGRRLSGGELKRLALARAMLCNHEILLLDEPFESLHTDQQEAIAEQINQLAQNRLIIIASHIHPASLEVTRVVELP